MYDKEKIYDEKIYPLMKQIIDICKEEDIQMIFSCYLRTDENGEFKSNTYIPSKEENSKTLQDARKVIEEKYAVQKPYFIGSTIYRELK